MKSITDVRIEMVKLLEDFDEDHPLWDVFVDLSDIEIYVLKLERELSYFKDFEEAKESVEYALNKMEF